MRTKEVLTFPKEGKEDTSFYQSEYRQVKGTNRKLHANVVCWKGDLKGHYQSCCPFVSKEKEEEVEEECNMHVEDSDYIIDSDSDDDRCYFQTICLMTKQIENNKELLWQIVLDTGLSTSVFNNSKLLKEIGTISRPL